MDYRVSFRVSQANLSLVFELMKNERGISLEAVTPITNEIQSADQPKRVFRFRDDKRFKGISGQELLMELTANGPAARDTIAVEFSKRGFAESSYSAAISKALQDGTLERLGNGSYRRPLAQKTVT